MNIIGNIETFFLNEEVQQELQRTALVSTGLMCAASVCGYAGTFFFTVIDPKKGAIYLASVALTSTVAYNILGNIINHPDLNYVLIDYILKGVQLIQIPIVFYLLPDLLKLQLSGSVKLEIIIATAHFVAIPIFFRLAYLTWNDFTLANAGTTTGVMLTLANGLRNYVAV